MLESRLERLGIGILTRSCPPELVDRVVGVAGCGEKRRRLLSARFTVYFVLALCLFPRVDYLEVLRLLKAGEPELREWSGVNKSSLTRARQRLGWQVMRDLHRAVVRLLGQDSDLFRGLRVSTGRGHDPRIRHRVRPNGPGSAGKRARSDGVPRARLRSGSG
ncbi:transposase domain-containing protein [Streptomyces sp. NPDC090054]|uniref:transposase domain-containing protein n=1 Tax=Streptomyces sp. NPDC090054 TaxID=3365933 RepID=UPI00381B0843